MRAKHGRSRRKKRTVSPVSDHIKMYRVCTTYEIKQKKNLVGGGEVLKNLSDTHTETSGFLSELTIIELNEL